MDDSDRSSKKTAPANPKSTKRTDEEPANKLKSPATNDFNLGFGWTNNEGTGLEAIFKAPRKSRTGIASGSGRSSVIQDPTKSKEGQGASEMEIREKNYEKRKSTGSGDGSSKKTVPANPKSTKRTDEEPANKLKSPATNDFNLGFGWTNDEETGLEAIFKAPRKSRSRSGRSSVTKNKEGERGSEMEIREKNYEKQKSTGSGYGCSKKMVPANRKSTQRTNEEPANKLKSPACSKDTRSQKLPRTNDFNLGLGWTGKEETRLSAIFKAPRKSRTSIGSGSARSSMFQEPMKNRKERQGASVMEITAKNFEKQKLTGSGDGSSKKAVPTNPKSRTNEQPAKKLKSPASSEDTSRKLARTNDFNLGLGWTGNEDTRLAAIFKAPRKPRTGIGSGNARSSMVQESMKNREERQGVSEMEITAKNSEKQKSIGSGEGLRQREIPDLNLPVNEEIVQLFGNSVSEPKNTRSSNLAPAGREAPAPQPVVNPPPVGPFFLTLQPNEEICTSLRSIAQQHPGDMISFTSAHGTLRSIQIFSESTRQTTNYEGPRTIVSFTGTCYLRETGSIYSKIMLVAGEDYDIVGGELERATVDDRTTVQFITFPRNLLG